MFAALVVVLAVSGPGKRLRRQRPEAELDAVPPGGERDRLAALAEAVEEVDVETLTPLAALNLLSDWTARFRRPPKNP